MFDFKDGNKPFGDWLMQFGIALIAGAVVGMATNIWVGVYALISGSIIFLVGINYKYTKSQKRVTKKRN
jgi:uncharacterized membrane protein YoaK (UPF0700 family)